MWSARLRLHATVNGGGREREREKSGGVESKGSVGSAEIFKNLGIAVL
jgi:hypothetical protein